MQQLVALGFLGHALGHVVEHEHKAGDLGASARHPLAGAHRRHLHAQQLPARHRGDELRRRPGVAFGHGPLNALEGVRQHLALQRRINRAANADQLGAIGQLGPLR